MNDHTADLDAVQITVSELVDALKTAGIVVNDCFDTDSQCDPDPELADEDRTILVNFSEMRDAELFLTLTCPQDDRYGSLWDVATGANLLTPHIAKEEGISYADARRVTRGLAWSWCIVPHISGRRVSWRMHVYIPYVYVPQVIGRLRASQETAGRPTD